MSCFPSSRLLSLTYTFVIISDWFMHSYVFCNDCTHMFAYLQLFSYHNVFYLFGYLAD